MRLGITDRKEKNGTDLGLRRQKVILGRKNEARKLYVNKNELGVSKRHMQVTRSGPVSTQSPSERGKSLEKRTKERRKRQQKRD